MNPFRLQIQPTPDGARVHCQWFGESALRPEGALTLPRATEEALPDRFVIDLGPLLAEVGANRIASSAQLAAADGLLALRDLLEPDGLAGLCAAIYPVLWRASRTAPTAVGHAPSPREGR